MFLEKIGSFLPILVLSVILLFGAMYAAFRALTIKMEDILKDVSKGMKIREEILKSMINIVKKISVDKFKSIENKLPLLEEFDNLDKPIDKVNFDEKLEEIILNFLNLPKDNIEFNENFQFVELTLRFKDLETKIINEKYRYNGIVEKYNLRIENSIGRFFSKLYGFNKKEKLYISNEIVDFLNNK